MSLGELAGLGAAFFWATTSLVVRSQAGLLSAPTINVIRSLTAGSLAVIAVAVARPDTFADGVPLVALALLFGSVLAAPGFGDTLYFESLRLIGVARAMILAGTNPLFAAALAVVLLGEQVTVPTTIGILLIVLGVYLVASGRQSSEIRPRDVQLGVALALGAAVLWGLGAVLVRPALEALDPLTANAIRLPLTALVIGVYGRCTGRLSPRADLSRRAVLAIMAAGCVSAFSTLLFLVCVQEAGAARAAALVSTSPLFAAPLATLLYREPLTVRLIAGMLVTITGIVLLVGR